MGQLGFKINLAKCVGCRACAVACNAELNTVKGTRYRTVVEKQGGTEIEPKRLFVTMSCFHCKEPACVNTCIGKALDFGEDVGNTGAAPSEFAPRNYTNPSVTFDWGWMEPW